MLLYVLKLKADLNPNYLNQYITKFSKLPFKSRFISVQLKLQSIDDQIYLIGNRCILDLKNPRTIKSYKLMIIDFYKKFLSIPNILKIKFVIFEYEELDKI